MSGKRLSLVGRVVAAAAIVLALAVPASASTIDLGMLGLNLSWNGSTFSATEIPLAATLSWIGPTPGFTTGTVNVFWNGPGGGDDLFTVTDTGGSLGSMLSGTITNFSWSFGGGIGVFTGEASVVSNPVLSLGNYVHFEIAGSTFGTGTTGTGDGDVTPAVPEPATLGLMSIGLGALAARRRRVRR